MNNDDDDDIVRTEFVRKVQNRGYFQIREKSTNDHISKHNYLVSYGSL